MRTPRAHCPLKFSKKSFILAKKPADSGCVFVDDSLKNVEAAQQIGMRAVHFTGPDVLVREFQALGLPVS